MAGRIDAGMLRAATATRRARRMRVPAGFDRHVSMTSITDGV
jgi:hypothetical protein